MKEKLAEFLNVFFGLRKVIAFFILFAVSIVFRVKGLVSGAEFVDLMKNVTLAFFAANGVEHIVAAVKDKLTKGAPQEGNLVPVSEADEASVESEGK